MNADGPARPLQVTIADVAAAAGVSRATATRALQGKGRFAEETRERVLEVSARLGYVPNTMAADLAAGRTGVVGLMLRDASNPAYGLLFSRLQEEAHRRGMELVTMTIGADTGGAKQVSALQRLLGMRVAGLIVATGSVDSEQLLPFAAEVPILRAGRPETSDRIGAVSYDEDTHGRLLAEHVLALGHRDVTVLATDPASSFPEHVRATAMRRTLEGGGARVHAIPVQAAPTDGMPEAIALASAGTVTAVMCSSDYRLLEFMRAARSRGLRVPDDVSATGCDGILPGADLLGITTVRLPVERVAAVTLDRMQRLLEGGDDDPPARELFAGRLLPGGTAAPRAS